MDQGLKHLEPLTLFEGLDLRDTTITAKGSANWA